MNNRRFFLLLVVISLVCTLVFSACHTQESQAPLAENNSNDTLKLLYWQAPTILNPHLSTGYKDAEAARITLEPLATFDEKGDLIPFLAAEVPTRENEGVAADGKSVTWKLKPGVKWSDGSPFTAADVVFTYEYITNPEVGAISAGTYETIASVEAMDEYTVKVNFKDVNPAWFLPFVGSEGMILPQHILAEFNGANAREAPANQKPIGTGPYQVVQFKPGDTVIYEPSPHFRAPEKLSFQRIELKGGGDAASAARAVLQTGEADYAFNLQVEAQVLQELEAAGKGKLLSSFGADMERILINQTDPNQATAAGERSSLQFPHPFFTNGKVRQALALAVDREAIAQQLYGATGKVTANFLVAPPEYVSPNTSYEFNLEKAAALLDEAGWIDSNGNGIRDQDGREMKVVFQSSVNPLRQKTQAVVKQALQTLGIEVELKSIDPSIFFSSDPANNDTIEHFSADLQMFTTGNNNPDPGAYMKTYTCDEIPQKENNWTGENHSRFCSQVFDDLWQKSNTELDSATRQQIFIEMNDLLVNEAVGIPLVHRANVVGIGNNITGVQLTPWDRGTWQIINWKRL